MTLSAEDAGDIARSREGDGVAYRRLVERHQADIGRLMWRFTRDRREWEELVQDVFVQAYRSLGRFRGECAFRTWLYRIATRLGYRHWKRQASGRELVPFEDGVHDRPREADPGAGVPPALAAAVAHSLLGKLAPRDRLVLTLLYLEEMDTAAIAAQTGWSRTMVKVQAHRARARLRKIVEQSGLMEKFAWTP